MMRPGEPPTKEAATTLFTNLFLSDVETASKAFKGSIVRKVKWKSNKLDEFPWEGMTCVDKTSNDMT